jgi:hypothetical protein
MKPGIIVMSILRGRAAEGPQVRATPAHGAERRHITITGSRQGPIVPETTDDELRRIEPLQHV